MDRILITKDNFVLPFDMLLNAAESEIPFAAEVVEEVETVPGRDGEVQLGQRYGATNHILVLRSWPDITEAEKDALKNALTTFMAKARAETVQLHYERTGRSYYVRLVGLPEKPQEYAGWLEIRLPLKAHDPHGYEHRERSATKTGRLDNRGNTNTPARIEFTGAATNPSCKVNGVTYSYSGTVPSGSRLVVDARHSTAVLVAANGNTTNANKGWCGRYLTLRPGFNDVQAVVAGKTSIFWKNRWA